MKFDKLRYSFVEEDKMEQNLPQQNSVNVNEMSKEQIELLIQNINKEIESLRADFKSKLERVLSPIGIKFAVVLKLAEKQEEIDEFVAILKGEKKPRESRQKRLRVQRAAVARQKRWVKKKI